MKKITDQEYKDLIIGVAQAISPEILKLKKDSLITAETVAIYSKYIADRVAHAKANPD